MIKTCTNLYNIKRPKTILILFQISVIARGLVVYGMGLMTSIFRIVQCIISSIGKTIGAGNVSWTVFHQEITNA